MAIRILRNETGNCINFVGSTQPAYWNGCLSARVNQEDSNRVDIINDIRTSDPNNPVFEFYAILYTDFVDADNNAFANAQEAADYITANGNVLGADVGAIQATANTTLDFQRDATNTTILSDDGRNAPVNAIKAFLGTNDLISIAENVLGANSAILYEGLYPDNITIAGASPASTASGVVNALNALFTVQPLGAGGFAGLASYQTEDGVTATTTKQEGVDPVGDAIYAPGSDTTSSHGARVWTTGTDYIDEIGEYFTFRIQNHGEFTVGVYDLDDSTQVAALSNDTGDGDSGLLWGNVFLDYGSYIAPGTVAGANTSHQVGPGWTNTDDTKLFRYNSALQEDITDGTGALLKVGITTEGRMAVSYYDIGRSNDWIETARTGYVLPDGRYGFVLKMKDGTVSLQSEPLIHKIDPVAPALNYRYIESPDGVFYYPLFATREEADYVSQYANTLFGTGYVNDANTNSDGYYSHAHVFVDEPTNTTWYMPDNYQFHSANSAPTSNSTISYSSIGTEADNLYAPSALNIQDFTYTENQTVNQQIIPSDDSATIQNSPSFEAALALVGLSYNASTKSIEGTTSYVPEDTTATVTLIRENVYGQTTDTFDITISDNASLGNLAGFTETAGNMVQPNRIILTHDALLQYDTTLSQGEELTFSYGSGNNPPTIGILSTLGQTNLNSFDPATDVLGASSTYNYAETNKWALRFVTFGGDIGSTETKHNLVGWTDNTTISGSDGDNNDITFKLIYSSVDGLIRLYRGDVLMLTSASSFTGAQTLTFAGFDDQAQSDIYIPTNLGIQTSTFGTTQPPSGFVNPLLTGQMFSSTLMGEGPDEDAAVQLSQALPVNHRMVFPQTWTETNILPYTADEVSNKAFVGVANGSPNWTDVGPEDFDVHFRIQGTSAASSYQSKLNNVTDETSVTINSLTDAFYDYALEWDGTDLHVIACNIGDINTQPAINAGGTFSRTLTKSAYGGTGDLDVALGVDTGGQINLSTSGISLIRTPFGIRDIVVAENSSGTGEFKVQPAAAAFDADSSGHAPSGYDFQSAGVSTLNAGQTYRFIYHPSMEANDSIEFRLASDNTTVYTTGITTFDGTSDGNPKTTEGYKGIEFAVPADAPPLTLYYKNNTTADAGRAITISGSTYVVPITGITKEGPAANQTSTNVMDAGDHGWISLDEQLSAGERLVLDNAFFTDFLAEVVDTNTIFAIGIKGDNWTNTKEVNTATAANTGGFFKGDTYLVGVSNSLGTGVEFRIVSGSTQSNTMTVSTSLFSTMCAFVDITSTGNNIRMGFGRNGNLSVTAGDESTVAYADWNAYKAQTGAQGYGITSADVVMSFWTFDGGAIDGAEIDWTGLSEISIPAPAASLTTNWTKAIHVNGGSEYMRQEHNGSDGALYQGTGTVALPTAGTTTGRAWAMGFVFKYNSSSTADQTIIGQAEASTGTGDVQMLKIINSNSAYNGYLRFDIGKGGSTNVARIGSSALTSGTWYGVYMDFNGARLSAADATSTNLTAAYRFKMVNLSTGAVSNLSQTWTTTGNQTDGTASGYNFVGGRLGAEPSDTTWASAVMTTLRGGQNLPTDTEISALVRDPLQWEIDYKNGNAFRSPNSTGDNPSNYDVVASRRMATQIWLMGDGTSDAYAVIRNQVVDSDQNDTPLRMYNMVSNDIQTVTITGLT